MKLDVECIRDILLETESFEMGCYAIDSYQKQVQAHGEDAVVYTIAKLHEAGYVEADIGMDEGGFYHLTCVYCMRYSGHQLLDRIRDEKHWSVTKKILAAVKDYSLSAISSVSEGVTAAAINAALEKLAPTGFPIISDEIRL